MAKLNSGNARILSLKEGDVVLIKPNTSVGCLPAQIHHPTLFFSDGRVVLTDAPRVKYSWSYNAYSHRGRRPVASATMVSNLIRKGYLHKYVKTFFRDSDRKGENIEPEILLNSPLYLFGNNLVSGTLRLLPPKKRRVTFNEVSYDFYLPDVLNKKSYRSFLAISAKNLDSIIVGVDSIEKELRGTDLELYIKEILNPFVRKK